jgi:hypothetical protein
MSGADGAAPRDAASGADSRVRLYRSPLRLAVSPSPWRSGWYLAGYVFATGWVLFAAGLLATVTTAVCAFTLAVIPLMVGAAAVLEGCANVERLRLRQVMPVPVTAAYRRAAGQRLAARAATRWRDPATWRDVAYLVGLWPPLFVLDTAVLAIWAALLACVTLPAWYWAPWMRYHGRDYHGFSLGFYYPHGPYGPGRIGYFIGSLPAALAAAAVGLAGFLFFSYVLVITARAHARVARTLLRPPADPLAEAKEVLAAPGPLGPLQTQVQNGGHAVGRSP